MTREADPRTIAMLTDAMRHCERANPSGDLTSEQQAEIAARDGNLASGVAMSVSDAGLLGVHPLAESVVDRDLDAALARAREGKNV